MELRKILDQLPIGKRKSESAVIDNIILVMREFGTEAVLGGEYEIEWKWWIFKIHFKVKKPAMNVPTFITILDFLRRQNEAEEREMRKAKMRK